MENAKVLYERILHGGKSEIDNLIDDKTAEHYFLDFKLKTDSDGGKLLDHYDRDNLATAMSGFANSQGGLLIWGVKKTDGKKGSMHLIKNPKMFVESLNRAVSEVITPFVDAVDSRVVFENSGEGVVVTHIPMSEKTPHRSLRDSHYYLRIGDSFKVMEHTQLEDMFGRRSRPKLKLEATISFAFASKPEPTFRLKLILNNIGKAITQHYGFDLELPAKLLQSSPRREGLVYEQSVTAVSKLKYRNSLVTSPVPIYPGEVVLLMPNNYVLGHEEFRLSKSQFESWKGMDLHYKVYSENMMTQEAVMKFGDMFGEDMSSIFV